MAIKGTALLALCTLLGAALGELLGKLLHVQANVGGVGLAMLMLMAARTWLARRGWLSPVFRLGVEFWAFLYIPIVVAMAAQQNVRAALSGGPMVAVAAVAVVGTCFMLVGVLGKAAGGAKGVGLGDAG
jgi:malonate transporter MadL subunit